MMRRAKNPGSDPKAMTRGLAPGERAGVRAVVVSAAFALTSCTMVGPNYQRPDSELPAAYAEKAPEQAGFSVPLQWWKLYQDPVLDDLVDAGLTRSTDVQAAAARLEEAEALLREARATLFFPEVDGNVGAARNRLEGKSAATEFTLGLSTSFEVDLWGRLRRSENVVRDQMLASRYARDTVSLTLAATIARSYFAVRSLDAQYKASLEIVESTNQSLSLAQKRSDGGVASILDVYQAGSVRSLATAQAKEIARQRAVVVHQLGVLTGRPDLALDQGDVTAMPRPPLAPAGLPSTLLERRPDVRAAEASLAAATERIGAARAAQFPALRLTASVGLASGELSDYFSRDNAVWGLGAGLVGPILDGGRYAARTQQAEAQAKQADANYRRAVREAFRDVSDALSNVRIAGDLETDLAQSVDVARKALRLANMRYERGYSAYLEVLDTQRTLNNAQLAWIRNRQGYLTYTVDLMNALGGGWDETTAATLASGAN